MAKTELQVFLGNDTSVGVHRIMLFGLPQEYVDINWTGKKIWISSANTKSKSYLQAIRSRQLTGTKRPFTADE